VIIGGFSMKILLAATAAALMLVPAYARGDRYDPSFGRGDYPRDRPTCGFGNFHANRANWPLAGDRNCPRYIWGFYIDRPVENMIREGFRMQREEVRARERAGEEALWEARRLAELELGEAYRQGGHGLPLKQAQPTCPKLSVLRC